MLEGASCARSAKVGALRVVMSLCILGALLAVPAAAGAAPAAPAYSNGHPYRHGAVPFRGHQHTVPFNAPGTPAASANNLTYGGGVSGVGVTTGHEKVYLVFWGSQWGSQSTNSSGYATFSGDPQGLASDVQAFFKGLGTGSETWSGVMTQYCQGVSTGARTCPASNTAHVGYPTGGALAGVWEDTSSAAPSAANGHQLAQEAENAATHFGNTTTTSNRNDQYVIISPTGTNPDNYQTQGFCAWHDYTGDSTLSGGGGASGSLIAFTNLPYVPDAGPSCGQSFVNSGTAGDLDGVTIVEGHEYAETVTDQFPVGGWTDSTQAENGDKCAWISSGQGRSQNISLTTGSFAVQSTWANDFNGGAGGCEVSHAIVTNGSGGNTVTVTSPGNQTTTVGTAVSLQIHASDSASGQTLTYTASGLPAGLSINSTSGVISGKPTTAATSSVTVTAKDTTGASGSTSFSWTVSSSGGGSCTAKQLLGNPGFETGSASPWSASSGVINPNGALETAHSGNWYAWLDGYGAPHTDTLAQTVTIGSGCHTDTFRFWLRIDTTESTSSAIDTLKVQVLNGSGTVLATLATYSNLNATAYVKKSFNVSAYAGQTIKVKFTGVEKDTAGGTTSFVIDDTALNQAS